MIGALILCIAWCAGGLYVGYVMGSLSAIKKYTDEIQRLHEELSKERLLRRLNALENDYP
ncbi:hypothetical protein ACSESA_26145 [Pseudomonas aeruginosa]|uniref:hypothetical protein n=1 Tax=Pseudomonas aeruginosa TaxID=287 RepID=UPI000F549462|nr:hypothetical protein [Pseudomonas aeruginosa]RPS59500.1 hypothetical protein IPC991_30430 [Pseudomonas aeruginosa]HBN8473718.1 hypothetical protein [Pseudomonas aeruginosa]